MRKQIIGVSTLCLIGIAAACSSSPNTNDGVGGQGGADSGSGGNSTGGKPATGGSATGGSATGGSSLGGGGGLGGMGGGATIESACAARCAKIAALACASDPAEPDCITNCEASAVGCEDQNLALAMCDAASSWECMTIPDIGSFAVRTDPSACSNEDAAYQACANPM